MHSFLINLQFFTSIPINKNLNIDEGNLKRSITTIPLLGLLEGLMAAFLLYFLIELTPFSPLIITFSLLIFKIVFTGGLHIDGFIDTADGYFSYRDKEKRLEIMTDPNVGAFGLIAVIVLLASRFLFSYETVLKLTPQSLILIGLIPFISKTVMGLFLIYVKSAKETGLAHFFQGAASKSSTLFYVIYFAIVTTIIAFVSLPLLSYFLILILAAVVFFIYYRAFFVKEFGGITGDILGAVVEGVELLLWMIILLLHYFVMG